MRVGVLWMVMLCLSDGEVTRCSVMRIITVSNLSKVSISCPSVIAKASEFKYLLFFNDSIISRIQLKSDHADSLFSGQFEATANNSGLYKCESQVIYPPPFTENCHTTEVIVAVIEKPLPAITVPVANQSCPVWSPIIPEVVMWTGCGVLLLYSLSITCIAIFVWRKSKKDEEDTNIYFNTRPRELKKPCKA